jgi:hypothetical protein
MSERIEEAANAAMAAAAGMGLNRHETLETALLMIERLMAETGAPEAVRYYAIQGLKRIEPRTMAAAVDGVLIDPEEES